MQTSDQLKQDITFEAQVRSLPLKFHTTWGIFSNRRIDDGTQILLDNVEVKPSDTILDIGCGYGPIGIALAKLAPQGHVHMVDKDYVAIEYAKKNAQINGANNCEIYLSNGLSNVPKEVQFDLVVTNIPAHIGNEMLYIILDDAMKRLKPGGRLYIVHMTKLREFIKRNFNKQFGNYKKVDHNKSYTLAIAVK